MKTKHRRDFDALESRRRKAMKLLSEGMSQAEVARRVGVSRVSVLRWKRLRDEKGEKAWKRKPLGRPVRMSVAQKEQLLKALGQGAQAHGFFGDLWTIPRIRQLVGRLFGIRLHATQVWRIMRGLGWTPQKPERRALERDEKAIALWKRETWPALKKKPSLNGA
jgi:transposase